VSPRLTWLGCLLLDGRWVEANRLLRDHPSPGNSYLRREITSTRATLAHHRGEPDLAWEEIDGLLAGGPQTEPGDIILQEGLCLQRLAAELCLDVGDLPRARAWLRAHDRWLVWSESVLGRADGQVAWARYHWTAGDVTRAGVAAVDALALASTPDQPLALLAAHRLLGEVETASMNRVAAEEHLKTALDLAVSCDAPFERALTLLALAHLHLASGVADVVAPLLDEVRGLCDPLGATPTLARVDALVERSSPRHPAGLT
jgi:hypothetical protein